ncbi:MAG: hypothetical protein K9G70_14180 [Prolixibacteraceae bacterium]|nr:hypothetical protein [Prolixibacteraceae bacterium]
MIFGLFCGCKFWAVRESLRATTGHNCNIRISLDEITSDILVEEALKMVEENPGTEKR